MTTTAGGSTGSSGSSITIGGGVSSSGSSPGRALARGGGVDDVFRGWVVRLQMQHDREDDVRFLYPGSGNRNIFQ